MIFAELLFMIILLAVLLSSYWHIKFLRFYQQNKGESDFWHIWHIWQIPPNRSPHIFTTPHTYICGGEGGGYDNMTIRIIIIIYII